MASATSTAGSRRLVLGSYQTALCIIPPTDLCQNIERVRSLHDKSYGKWPPHINVIYPFVTIDKLPEAVEQIRSNLRSIESKALLDLCLNKPDHFSHRHSNTIYITAEAENGGRILQELRKVLLVGFGSQDTEYRPHLTIGQSKGQGASSRELLLGQGNLLLPIEWKVESFQVLVRERTHQGSDASSKMRLWGTITLNSTLALESSEPSKTTVSP